LRFPIQNQVRQNAFRKRKLKLGISNSVSDSTDSTRGRWSMNPRKLAGDVKKR
jgi:hypothetical protein